MGDLTENERQCKICGKNFIPIRKDIPGLYCGRKCSGKANIKPFVLREGYQCVFLPNHPRAKKSGYVSKQYIVMEQYSGPILQDEVVHHINEDRTDNRIHNLMLMSDSNHKRHHALKRSRISGRFNA